MFADKTPELEDEQSYLVDAQTLLRTRGKRQRREVARTARISYDKLVKLENGSTRTISGSDAKRLAGVFRLKDPRTLLSPDAQMVGGPTSNVTGQLHACISDLMNELGLATKNQPAFALELVQRAIEEEAMRGILESRIIPTHEFVNSGFIEQIASFGCLPLLAATLTVPPIEIAEFGPIAVSVPVSLVASYALLEFTRTRWNFPFDIRLADTASALPLLANLEKQSPEIAIVPASLHPVLCRSSMREKYLPITTVGRGTHSLIVSNSLSMHVHEFAQKRHEILCIGNTTPQRFISDLGRLRLLDKQKLIVTAKDAGSGVMLPASQDALINDAVVVAFFPMNAIMSSIGMGEAVCLDRLEESTSSHLLLVRHDRAQDVKWCELLTRILHTARDCLAREPRYCATLVRDILESKTFIEAFVRCLKA